jgi:hypothetical protein
MVGHPRDPGPDENRASRADLGRYRGMRWKVPDGPAAPADELPPD